MEDSRLSNIEERIDTLAWMAVCHARKCFWCKTEFPNGIVIPMPRDLDTPLENRICADFYFHAKDCHGFEPHLLVWMLKEILRPGAK